MQMLRWLYGGGGGCSRDVVKTWICVLSGSYKYNFWMSDLLMWCDLKSVSISINLFMYCTRNEYVCTLLILSLRIILKYIFDVSFMKTKTFIKQPKLNILFEKNLICFVIEWFIIVLYIFQITEKTTCRTLRKTSCRVRRRLYHRRRVTPSPSAARCPPPAHSQVSAGWSEDQMWDQRIKYQIKWCNVSQLIKIISYQ